MLWDNKINHLAAYLLVRHSKLTCINKGVKNTALSSVIPIAFFSVNNSRVFKFKVNHRIANLDYFHIIDIRVVVFLMGFLIDSINIRNNTVNS